MIPLFNGKRGHPPLYDLLEVETGCGGILKDIDAPEDYSRELK